MNGFRDEALTLLDDFEDGPNQRNPGQTGELYYRQEKMTQYQTDYGEEVDTARSQGREPWSFYKKN
jgi:hypothetical protein